MSFLNMEEQIIHLILTQKIQSKNIDYHLDLQRKIVNYFKEFTKNNDNISIKIYIV